MFFKPQHLHFVGIGGIGMSGIAEVLLNWAITITGSDLKLIADHRAPGAAGRDDLRRPRRGECRRREGRGGQFRGAMTDNPEVQEARRLQIPVIPRGELLAELMRLKYGIAIAGSHGKTTTTSMVATILSHAGLDPTVVVGGKVAAMGGSNARVGKSDFLVVESDESDGSFLKLAPDPGGGDEHRSRASGSLRRPSKRSARRSLEFVNKVPFYGAAILCLDDENVQQILPRDQPPHHHLRTQRAGRPADRRRRMRRTSTATFSCACAASDLG